MPHKRASYDLAEFKADADKKGEFTAIVSVFGNVDKGGDRVMPGAFANSLAKWDQSGAPIPVIWSHDWSDPFSNIGAVTKAAEVDKGLQITGKLDVDSNPIAAQVFKLLDERRVKEFSFGYQIAKGGERAAKDGATELTDLEILEVGPTFRGMNPATELLATKAATETLAESLTELGLDLEWLKKLGPPSEMQKLVADIDAGTGTVTTTNGIGFGTVDLGAYDLTTNVGIKAGAQHSRATRERLAALRQRVTDIGAEIDDILGTDEPKSQADHMPPAKSDSEPEHESNTDMPPATSVDDETLALTIRLEQAKL